MFFTGFADEAADGIEGQVAAIQALGWTHIELRNVNGKNITDVTDAEFNAVRQAVSDAGLIVNAFGSNIANWGKSILEPMDDSLAEARRAIPRMQALGTRFVRIMSFGILHDREPEDQLFEERVKRLRVIQKLFADAGLEVLHENCANYGGMGPAFTLRLLEALPGLRLIFDTANPATSLDRSRPKPYLTQNSWEFYQQVKEHIAHVHIKDGRFIGVKPGAVFEDAEYVWPGEGDGDVRRIVGDLLARGYDGGFSMEPHMGVVYHDASVSSSEEARRTQFVEYGQRFERLVEEV